MGNCAALKENSNRRASTVVQVGPKRPALCLDKQGTSTKYLLYKSIQNKDLETTKKLYTYFDIDPNEEVSVQGYHWTALHYAAFFDSTIHMEFFLKLIYAKSQDNFVDIVNLQTRENYTPLMIAAMHGRRLIVDQLLKFGGVKLNLKDKKGRTAKELAKSNGKSNCAQIISDHEGRATNPMPTNDALLKAFDFIENDANINKNKVQSIEDDAKFEELLLKGKRIPCIICQEDNGLIKYTKCCGQPLHAGCIEGKLKACPYCKCGGLNLIHEVLFPERAFEL